MNYYSIIITSIIINMTTIMFNTNHNIIINDTIDFGYKITLNGTADPNLANFCIKHKNKIKIGNRVLSNIQRGYNLKGMYMYVKDFATITLIRLFLKKDLMRIDKIVSSKDLDK